MTEWNEDLVRYRIERARETLEDARILEKSKRWKASVNRLYYAIMRFLRSSSQEACILPSTQEYEVCSIFIL